MASGSGCKEAYRLPHTTYPYSSCICSFFAAASLLFVHFLNVFRSCNNWTEAVLESFYIILFIENKCFFPSPHATISILVF